MSVVTSPPSTHTPAYGQPGGGGSVLTRPGWWRALFWTIFAAVLAIASPGARARDRRLAVVAVRGHVAASS